MRHLLQQRLAEADVLRVRRLVQQDLLEQHDDRLAHRDPLVMQQLLQAFQVLVGQPLVAADDVLAQQLHAFFAHRNSAIVESAGDHSADIISLYQVVVAL